MPLFHFIQADDNKDGSLSLDEMLNHEDIFYSTVYDENNEDYDEDFHDELWAVIPRTLKPEILFVN